MELAASVLYCGTETLMLLQFAHTGARTTHARTDTAGSIHSRAG